MNTLEILSKFIKEAKKARTTLDESIANLEVNLKEIELLQNKLSDLRSKMSIPFRKEPK